MKSGTDADEAAKEQLERLVDVGIDLLAIEVQDSNSRGQSFGDRGRIGGIWVGSGDGSWHWDKVAWILPCQVELTLEILLCDFYVAQGHVGGAVAQEFHQRRHADTSAQHASCIGMAQLVWNDV